MTCMSKDAKIHKDMEFEKCPILQSYLYDLYLTLEQITALYNFGQFQYTYGNYSDATDCLYHFCVLSTDNDLNISTHWGKLASDILTGKWDVALKELNTLQDIIDLLSPSLHLFQPSSRPHPAPRELTLVEQVVGDNFFLGEFREEFLDNARYLISEAYCQTHQRIDIGHICAILITMNDLTFCLSDLSEGLNLSKDEGEKWIINLICGTCMGADAKIDLEKVPFPFLASPSLPCY